MLNLIDLHVAKNENSLSLEILKSPRLLEAGKIGHVTYVLKGTIYYETTLEATLVVNCHERKHQDKASR